MGFTNTNLVTFTISLAYYVQCGERTCFDSADKVNHKAFYAAASLIDCLVALYSHKL